MASVENLRAKQLSRFKSEGSKSSIDGKYSERIEASNIVYSSVINYWQGLENRLSGCLLDEDDRYSPDGTDRCTPEGEGTNICSPEGTDRRLPEETDSCGDMSDDSDHDDDDDEEVSDEFSDEDWLQKMKENSTEEIPEKTEEQKREEEQINRIHELIRLFRNSEEKFMKSCERIEKSILRMTQMKIFQLGKS